MRTKQDTKKIDIKIVAPASKMPGEEQCIEEIKHLFKSHGEFRINVSLDIFDNSDLFCAASLENRKKDFLDGLTSDKVDILWAYRGGYGSMEIIPYLEQHRPFRAFKLLIGFSDITALHLYFNQILKWPSLHATVLDRIARKVNSDDLQDIIDCIGKSKKDLSYPVIPINIMAKKITQSNENILGDMIGGNLSVVQHSMGTCWQLNGNNKIIFFEDVGERGYKIRSKLEQLKQANIFSTAKAIIFGEFIDGAEKNGKDHTGLVIESFASQINIPVFRMSQVGHTAVNKPLFLGCMGRIHKGIISIPNPLKER
jgi:muramoyltetrapeptide carboxypeptidase